MKTLFLVLLLSILVLVGGKALKVGSSSRFYSLGIVSLEALFLFLGVLLGPRGVDLLTYEVLKQLGPFVVLALCWIGFLFGTNFKFAELKQFSLKLHGISHWQAIVTFFSIFLFFYFGFDSTLFAQVAYKDKFIGISVLAATAAGTSPSIIFFLSHLRESVQSAEFKLLKFIASLDDLFGLLVLGCLYSFAHYTFAEEMTITWKWAFINLFAGVSFGIFSRVLFKSAKENRQLHLFIFGLLFLMGGVSSFFNLSPLFISFLAGLMFTNMTMKNRKVYDFLAYREHPIYLIFLVIIGSMWKFEFSHILLPFLVYLLLRMLGKILGAFTGAIVFLQKPLRPNSKFALMLIPQGGIVIAIVVDYHRTYSSGIGDLIITIVILSLLVNNMLSALLSSFFSQKT